MPVDNTQLMVEMAKRQLSKEMPHEMQSARIEPENGAWSNDKTLAYTTPTNDIKYKAGEFKSLDLPTITDLLAHELTHVKQQNEVPIWRRLFDAVVARTDQLPYGQDPDELEAFQVMRDRQLKDHRKPQFANVQFDPNADVRVDDINLPAENKHVLNTKR